jgi:hypothetical protein
MNWKLLISVVLLLVLIPVSAFGLACDVRCTLEAMTVDHCHVPHAHSGNSNASASMDMPGMHCHSMHHMHGASSSQSTTSCEPTSQACSQEHCASDASWLVGQKSPSKESVLSPISPLQMAMSASGTATTPPLSSPRSLPPPIYRPLAILRI